MTTGKTYLLFFALSAPVLTACGETDKESLSTVSPDGDIKVSLLASSDSCLQPSLSCHFDDKTAIDHIAIGLRTAGADFTALRLVDATDASPITEDYTMLTGKRSHCVNHGRQRTYKFVNQAMDSLYLTLRVFDDGVAFRYELPNASANDSITEEATTYGIKSGVNRWASPYDLSYERFYEAHSGGEPSQWGESNRWSYPMLVEPADSVFMLITEAGMKRGHCASWLDNSANADEYRVTPADPRQGCANGWQSPWRVIIMGTLADVVESTLVTDVSEPSQVQDTSWISPGTASWIYWAYNHGSKDYKTVTEYIDLAAEMGWPYVLIDWEWSEMTNGGDIDDAIAYARTKGVKPLLWYNSSTAWLDPTPLYRLNEKVNRDNEYKMLHDKGVAGVKIDFFDGDHSRTIDYYIDLLEDAVAQQQLVTFHGATIPRGWQRTYPHMMTVEGVLGAEWYNNDSFLTPAAARHNATLPFTRNVVGPMDYTPGTFTDSQHPHITSHGHELALYYLFESAIQHMPDRPAAYRTLPDAVKALLKTLPTAWTDTRLLSGYPGRDVVIARNSGGKWYVAGINGEDSPKTISVDLSQLHSDAKTMTVVSDGQTQTEFSIQDNIPVEDSINIPCLPRGGFVIAL